MRWSAFLHAPAAALATLICAAVPAAHAAPACPDPAACVAKVYSGTAAPGAAPQVDGRPITKAPGRFRSQRPAVIPAAFAGFHVAVRATPAEVAAAMGGRRAARYLAAPAGCGWTPQNVKWAENAVGVTLWKIWQNVAWCWSNWSVEWPNLWGWNDVYTFPGWGVSDRVWSKRWVNQPATAVAFSSATFTGPEVCIPFVTCLRQHDYPTMQMFVNGAGRWWPG